MRRPDHRILTAVLGLLLFLLPACGPAPAPDRTTFAAPIASFGQIDRRAVGQQMLAEGHHLPFERG